MPYILTTFANDQRNFLEDLGKEDDQVQYALLPGAMDGRYTVFRDSFITRDKLAHYLRLLRYDLFCFHFSGHAGENILQLDDGNARAEGMLGLLSSCLPSLKLVVLNGCGTLRQAEALHAAGVPCVIATTAPVGDTTATEFSIAFYRELMQGQTIQVAFDLGMDAVKLRRKVTVLRTPPDAGNKEEIGTWYFFCQEEAGELVLPKVKAPAPEFYFEPNSILTKELFQNPALQSRILKRFREDVADGIYVSDGYRQDAIYKCLPAPIGLALQELFCPVDGEEGFDHISTARLQQIVVTYVILMETMIYTLIAQLFEHILKEDQKVTPVPELLDQEIRRFLNLKDTDRNGYQYIYLIRILRLYLEEAKVDFFVSEFSDLAKIFNTKNSRFTIACAEIEALRLRLTLEDSNIAKTMVGPLCRDAEQNLSDILGHLGFISNYTMAIVRNIEVIKYKHQSVAHYMHQLVRLVDSYGKVKAEELPIKDFMDNRSVLLVKSFDRYVFDELPQFLNLSPFVVDISAFVPHSDASDIYFYHKGDVLDEQLFVRSLTDPENNLRPINKRQEIVVAEANVDPIVRQREAYIYEQFETFLALLDQFKTAA